MGVGAIRPAARPPCAGATAPRSIRLLTASMLVFAAPAADETLMPIDAQDPAFARISRERAPTRLWNTEIARSALSWRKSLRLEPQRHTDYLGLLLLGDGRALLAFRERDAAQSSDPILLDKTEGGPSGQFAHDASTPRAEAGSLRSA